MSDVTLPAVPAHGVTGSAAGPLTRLDHLVGRGTPDHPALTFKESTVTYADLAFEARTVG